MVHSLFERETRKDTTGFDLVLSLIRRLLLEESEKNPTTTTRVRENTYTHAHIYACAYTIFENKSFIKKRNDENVI